MTNTLNTPVESLESHYPLRVERYALRRGSGGAGLHRGGDGIEGFKLGTNRKDHGLLLRDVLIPACNQFGYGQVESPYGSGQFIKDIRGSFGDNEKLVTSEITSKDDIMDSIKEFLKGGR